MTAISNLSTILSGTPCNLTISRIYKSASLSMDILRLISKKWVHFVSRSTITQMASCPFINLGKWVTKSMKTLSHFHWGMSSGYRVPPGLWCSILAFWHTKHAATMSATSVFIPGHQNDSFKSLYIFVIPECIMRWPLCPSSKILLLVL